MSGGGIGHEEHFTNYRFVYAKHYFQRRTLLQECAANPEILGLLRDTCQLEGSQPAWARDAVKLSFSCELARQNRYAISRGQMRHSLDSPWLL